MMLSKSGEPLNIFKPIIKNLGSMSAFLAVFASFGAMNRRFSKKTM
jgi:hypothetical protein